MLMGMLYHTILCLYVSADHVGVYLHIGVGFGVARFTELGNAKASMRGTSGSTDSRAFSLLIMYC